MKTKLFKIYFPFVLIVFGFVELYAFLYWLIVLKLDLIQPIDGVANFGVPLVISALIVFFFYRRRIKLLKISDKRVDFYTFISLVFFAIPVIAGQGYLVNQQGKLTKIEKISQIDLNNQTLFYSIDSAHILKEEAGLWVTRTNVDKYGNEVSIKCSFVRPLVDTVRNFNSNSKKYKTWIGVSFSENFSNRAFDDKEEQKIKIDNFINTCISKFEDYQFQTTYLRNLKYSDSRKDYYSAIETTKLNVDKNELIIFEEEEGTYETRTGSRFIWLMIILFSVNLIWFLLIFFPQLNASEVRKLGSIKEKGIRRKKYKEILLIFTPTKNNWATPVILDLNIIVFVIMIYSGVGFMEPQAKELIEWGANFKPSTIDGQWWRLITSIFIHVGLIHLVFNMLALFYIGSFLELSIGSKKFMIIYLLTGLIAGITSLIFHDFTISVGASGAVFGLYGLTLSLMVLKYLDKKLTPMIWVSVTLFVALNLIMSFSGGVNLAAHLGGLLAGFIIGIIYFPFKKYLDESG